jgi:anti-sigma28 factor (negative regulator of flagellin synthesis)
LNKKDIANFKRQFKVSNDLLKIHEIFYVYIMKESSDIYHHQSFPFEMLEEEQKELFMDNFKKVLSGQLDEKLFELKFQRDVEDSSQLILHQGLLSRDTDEWKGHMLRLVEKMLNDKQYEMDIVVTFIRGEYMKPAKRRNEESETSERDTVFSNPFILCSMNSTQDPKKELLFDYVEKQFKYNIVVDPIINLKAPLSGFLFPCFSDNAADVNHVLYSAGKKYELSYHFIEEVLNAEETMTAEDDKIVFEEIVKKVAGDKINTSTLSNVYDEIHRVIEENEEEEVPKLDYKDVEKVLRTSGVKDVDTEKVEEAFKTVIDDGNYELKASNILPKYSSKSIKVKTKVADLSISPPELRHVRQVHLNGKIYLMIELEENTMIEGFEMVPEALFQKAEE